MLQRTYTMKKDEIQRTWWVVDAAGKPVGRVAAQVARLLQGKHKPTYTPHMDMGDHVIILNAEKAIFTGKKLDEVLYHHTMHPGGLRAYTRRKLMTEKPETDDDARGEPDAPQEQAPRTDAQAVARVRRRGTPPPRATATTVPTIRRE
jgi:hypothetical protein